ncbi:MAG TPA: hypothetical protein VIR01_11880, partial [Pyrinomonadaceae bacterium]
MDLKFECPSCGQHLTAIRSQIGVTAPCPNCNAAVTVPKISTLPHAPLQTKCRKKKRRKTTVILIENSAVAPKTKEVKKWTGDPAETRNWLIDRLSEIHAGKYLAGIFDQKTVEVPSRTERLAFWRDEYALDSFTVLQRLLAFMLSQSQ